MANPTAPMTRAQFHAQASMQNLSTSTVDSIYYNQYLPKAQADYKAAVDAAKTQGSGTGGGAGSGTGSSGGGAGASQYIAGAGTGLQGWSMYQGMNAQKAANLAQKTQTNAQRLRDIANAKVQIAKLDGELARNTISKASYDKALSGWKAVMKGEPSFITGPDGMPTPSPTFLKHWQAADNARMNSDLLGASLKEDSALRELAEQDIWDNTPNPFEIESKPSTWGKIKNLWNNKFIQSKPVQGAIFVASSILAFKGLDALTHGAWTFKERIGGLLKFGSGVFGMAGTIGNVFSYFARFSVPQLMIASAVAIAVVWGITKLFGKKKKKAEPTAAEEGGDELAYKVSHIWTPGSIVMLGTGLALAGLGINLNPDAPMFSEVMVSAAAVQNLASTYTDEAGKAADPMSSVFVYHTNGEDRVVYFTPGADGKQMQAHVVTLKGNTRWGKPDDPTKEAYIPFFGPDGKPNRDALNAMEKEAALARASTAMSGPGGNASLQAGGSSNKQGSGI